LNGCPICGVCSTKSISGGDLIERLLDVYATSLRENRLRKTKADKKESEQSLHA
jgi:hypothetical protein